MRFRTVTLITAFALGILAAPLAIGAQPPAKTFRVGVLSTVTPRTAPQFEALRQRLGELGYVEGENTVIEFRNAQGRVDRLPGLAAELVRLNVDVIVAPGPEATLKAARQATGTIPIVMVAVDYDPIALGYVAGLARPGGNITGVFLRQPELTAKRLELLKEAVPKVSRVAVLRDQLSGDEQLKAAEAAARSLRLQLQSLEFRNPPYDFEGAFRAAAQGRVGALLVLNSPIIFQGRAQIIELAAKSRLPTMSGIQGFAEAGGLMSYGASLVEMFRIAAAHVDKIFKGAKPADLPV